MASTHPATSTHNDAQISPASTLPDLHDRLDSLWISYLRHLDAYTTAQKTLQRHLRSGFFSLSRANFQARPGMRYGQDYFHDRAVATRRVEVTQGDGADGDGKLRLGVVRRARVSHNDANDEAPEREGLAGEALQQPSPPPKPTSKDEKAKAASEEENDGSTAKPAKPKPPLEADPLRWFGILIPQELRSAQTSFSSAVDESVAGAVSASRAMREVEFEIRKTRKEVRRAEKANKG